MMEYIVKSSYDMIKLGKNLVENTQFNKFLIYGSLGAGKTLLVKGFAEGLGISPDKVISPTYVYLNIYENALAHIDFYRFHELDLSQDEIENQLIQKGLLEAIENYPFVAIEWPILENLYVDKTRKKVKIEKINNTERRVLVE